MHKRITSLPNTTKNQKEEAIKMPKKSEKKTTKKHTDKPKKEVKKGSGKPAKTTQNKEKKDTPDTSQSTSQATIIIIAIIIIAIAAFLIISFQKNIHEKGLEDKCKEIENHPYLNYECKCTPIQEKEDSLKDEVEKRTTALCRCTCDIGNGTLWTTDVRVAK